MKAKEKPSQELKSGIFALTDPDTGKIYFIGKSSNYSHQYLICLTPSVVKKNSKKNAWIRSILEKGKRPGFILIKKCSVESLSAELDKAIKFYRKTEPNLIVEAWGSYNHKKVIASNYEMFPEGILFDSIKAAADYTKKDPSTVSGMLSGRIKTSKSWFYWNEGDKPKLPEQKKKSKEFRPISCSNGKDYESIKECVLDLNLNNRSVGRALKKKTACKGFYFWDKGTPQPQIKNFRKFVICKTSGKVYDSARDAALDLNLTETQVNGALSGKSHFNIKTEYKLNWISDRKLNRIKNPFTIEQLTKVVSLFSTVIDFSKSKKYKRQYRAIQNNEDLHYLLNGLVPINVPEYTEEELKEIISKYEYLGDFKKDSGRAYRFCVKNYKDLLKVLKRRVDAGYKEDYLIELAKTVASKTEFIYKYPSQYNKINKLGINEKAFAHAPKSFRSSSIQEEACRVIFQGLFNCSFNKFNKIINKRRLELDGFNEELSLAFEFHGIQHYKYLKRYDKKKDGRCLIEQQQRDRKKLRYCKNKNITLIVIPYWIKFFDLQSFIEKELKFKNISFVTRPIDLLTAPLTPGIKWDYQSCLKEAQKYLSKTDFKNGSKSACSTAVRHGWLDSICSHMNPKTKPRNYWTKETSLEECKKYKNFTEFRTKAFGAAEFIYLHGLQDEMRAAMGITMEDHSSWKKRNPYTKDEIRAKYKLCKTISQFRHKYKGYYTDSIKMGMQDELIKNLIVMNPESLYPR